MFSFSNSYENSILSNLILFDPLTQNIFPKYSSTARFTLHGSLHQRSLTSIPFNPLLILRYLIIKILRICIPCCSQLHLAFWFSIDISLAVIIFSSLSNLMHSILFSSSKLLSLRKLSLSSICLTISFFSVCDPPISYQGMKTKDKVPYIECPKWFRAQFVDFNTNTQWSKTYLILL